MVVQTKALVILAMSLVAISTTASAQGRDPHLTWNTIKTEHFEVHYHDPLKPLADKITRVAERAHAKLAPRLLHNPRARTHIVVSDQTDSANGFARVLPYNTIQVFATAPDDLSALNDFDDWMRVLVTHEHTHVLHLDNTGGLPSLINAVFGKIYAPNSIQPRWFIEGLAVHEESEHTSSGRLRSTIFDMYMRMDALQGRLLRLDQISHQVDRWPHGNVWYLYGSRVVRFVSDTYGDEALGKISEQYGSKLVPYGLSRSVKRVTGKTWPQLYDSFIKSTKEHYQKQFESLQQEGLRQGKRITQHGELTRSPRFMNDDQIAYWTSDGRSYGEIRKTSWKNTSSKPVPIVRANSPGAMAVEGANGELLFSASDTFRDIYSFSDLFSHNPSKNETIRLTRGLRAREPDVSPDGSVVTFTVNSAGTTHLALAERRDIQGTKRILLRSHRYDQVFTPRFSPDGTKIVYSVWQRGGYRDIHVIDVQTGRVTRITHDRAIDSGPLWSNDGKHLYFSSDRTGIANIYVRNLETGSEKKVTNVVGGAYQPALSPNGKTLAYLGYTTWGYDLFAMPLPSVDSLPKALQAASRHEIPEEEPTKTSEVQNYNPLPTLAPRSYELELSEDGFGSSLSLITTGQDVVGFHSYQARVEVGLEETNVNASLAWTIQRSILPITLDVFTERSPRRDLVVAGENRTWIQNARGGGIALRYPIPRAFETETLQVSYRLTHLSKGRDFGGELDPGDAPPVLPALGWFPRLSLQWGYNNLVRTRYDISPSFGRNVSVSTSIEHPAIGSRFRTISLRWSLRQYIENPWVEHHVLAFGVRGGIGGGQVDRRPLFSLGGFQNQDLLQSLLDGSLLGGSTLRGYPQGSFFGNQFHLAQLEYRFPIYRPQFGADTLPFFINRIYGNVFTDVGAAFFGAFSIDDLHVGSGLEVLLDFTTEYVTGLTLRLGLAHGFHSEGHTHGYANLGVPF